MLFLPNCLVLLMVAVAPNSRQTTSENGAVAAPRECIEFDGEKLYLAWEGGTPAESIKEYVPEGQDLETWTTLASIRHYPQLNDPTEAVRTLNRVLEEKYPRSPRHIEQVEDSDDAMIEFVVWQGDGDMQEAQFVEYNLFKYSRNDQGGLVAQQFARRGYGRQIGEFLKQFEPQKQRLRQQMADEGLKPVAPEID